MQGLALTDAASASLLLNLEAVFTLVIAWVVFREHVDRRLFAGAAAIVAGALLLSWQGELGALSWGAALIALACLSWGIDNNLTRKISAADPVHPCRREGRCSGQREHGSGPCLRRPSFLQSATSSAAWRWVS